MTIMQYCGALLMLSTHLVVPSPLMDTNNIYNSRQCKLCPPGQYQKSCVECADCPEGTYTSHLNSEPSCHSCFKDCRPEFHMQEESRCTTKSNVRCHCQSGFKCSDFDSDTLCTECVKLLEPVPQVDSTLISVQKNRTEIPFQTVGAMTTPCHAPKRCGGHLIPEDNATHQTSETSKYTAAMLGSVLVIGIIAVVLLSCIRRPTEETCFKQAVKLCNEVQSMSTAPAGRSSSAYSVTLLVRESQPARRGRGLRTRERRRRKRVVLCFIPPPPPTPTFPRKRERESWTRYSSLPRNKGKTTMYPKRRCYKENYSKLLKHYEPQR